MCLVLCVLACVCACVAGMQAMLQQVKSFTQRKLADALRLRDLSVDMAALLIAVKVAMLELDQVLIPHPLLAT
jgi:hypothetical protein